MRRKIRDNDSVHTLNKILKIKEIGTLKEDNNNGINR